ncbi:MAG: methyltransferase domain-containing protein [Planctomycetota bacterium]
MFNVNHDIKQKVQQQFGPAAGAYAKSDVHAAGESLEVLAELVSTQPSWHALDVATGAGHTALLFAPRVERMVAFDLTSAMLAQAAKLAGERNYRNVECVEGDAESLPFPDRTFDLVTCRLAFHHFPKPEKALSEFFRVLKTGGIVGFTDNLTVEAPAAAAYYNRYETLRDPSHVEVYSASKLQEMFAEAGFMVNASRRLSKEFEFHDWADRQRVSEDHKQQLLQMMRRIPQDLETLFHPRWTAETMYFCLWETVLVATKSG